MSALLQLHLYSQLNTRLQWIEQRQLQDETWNTWVLGFGGTFSRGVTVRDENQCKLYKQWPMVAARWLTNLKWGIEISRPLICNAIYTLLSYSSFYNSHQTKIIYNSHMAAISWGYILPGIYSHEKAVNSKPRAHFTNDFFPLSFSFNKILFYCNSIPGHHIATIFCTCHGSCAVAITSLAFW